MQRTATDILPGSQPAQSSLTAARSRPWSAESAAAAALTLAGFLLACSFALLSAGTYHDDDLTHFQIARWAWIWPSYLLDDWGRPGFTVLYAPAAALGWTAARLFSAALTALTAWLTYLIARDMQIRLASLAPALLWLQPLTFTLSYTTLTETPLALYVTAAVYLWQRRRFALSAAVISLSAVTRHEGVLFLTVWFVAMLAERRRVHELLLLAWAPVLANLLSTIALGETPLLLYLTPKPTAAYGAGGPLTMLTRWALAAGLGPLVLAAMGAGSLWRKRGGRLWLVAGLLYFLAHTFFFRFGLFASGGYARFLVPLGPLVAVAAAAAASQLWRALRRTGGKPVPQAVALRDAVVPIPAVAPVCNRCGSPASAAQQSEQSEQAFHLRVPSSLLLTGTAMLFLLWLASAAELERYWSLVRQYNVGWTRWFLHGIGLGLVALGAAAAALTLSPRKHLRLAGFLLLPGMLLAATLLQPMAAARLPHPVAHCRPFALTPRQQAYFDAVAFVRTAGLVDRRLFSSSPWLDEFAGLRRPPRYEPVAQAFAALQPGDILLWDGREAGSPRHGLYFDELAARPDLRLLWRSESGEIGEPIHAAVFECIAPPREEGRS